MTVSDASENWSIRAVTLGAEGYTPDEIEGLLKAEWRVGQAMLIERCEDIRPISNNQAKDIRKWISSGVDAETILASLRTRRAEIAGREAIRREIRRASATEGG